MLSRAQTTNPDAATGFGGSPFELANETAYRDWRASKLAVRGTVNPQRCVELAQPGELSVDEAGVLAAQPFESVLVGDESLSVDSAATNERRADLAAT